jgi:hypothetical protein
LGHGEKDEELAKLIIAARMLFGYYNSVEDKLITNDLRKAYELGFMRGFRTAKQEDMPWCFKEEDEKEKDRKHFYGM